jgi:hypothetical protein
MMMMMMNSQCLLKQIKQSIRVFIGPQLQDAKGKEASTEQD